MCWVGYDEFIGNVIGAMWFTFCNIYETWIKYFSSLFVSYVMIGATSFS